MWLVSTIRETSSVTDLNVCPGAITRYSPVTGSTIGLLTGASFVAIVSFAFALGILFYRLFPAGPSLVFRSHFARFMLPYVEYLPALLPALR